MYIRHIYIPVIFHIFSIGQTLPLIHGNKNIRECNEIIPSCSRSHYAPPWWLHHSCMLPYRPVPRAQLLAGEALDNQDSCHNEITWLAATSRITCTTWSSREVVMTWKFFPHYWSLCAGNRQPALCKEIHRSPVEFPLEGSVMRNFDVFFIVFWNMLLNKQSIIQWFEASVWYNQSQQLQIEVLPHKAKLLQVANHICNLKYIVLTSPPILGHLPFFSM